MYVSLFTVIFIIVVISHPVRPSCIIYSFLQEKGSGVLAAISSHNSSYGQDQTIEKQMKHDNTLTIEREKLRRENSYLKSRPSVTPGSRSHSRASSPRNESEKTSRNSAGGTPPPGTMDDDARSHSHEKLREKHEKQDSAKGLNSGTPGSRSASESRRASHTPQLTQFYDDRDYYGNVIGGGEVITPISQINHSNTTKSSKDNRGNKDVATELSRPRSNSRTASRHPSRSTSRAPSERIIEVSENSEKSEKSEKSTVSSSSKRTGARPPPRSTVRMDSFEPLVPEDPLLRPPDEEGMALAAAGGTSSSSWTLWVLFSICGCYSLFVSVIRLNCTFLFSFLFIQLDFFLIATAID